MERSLEPYQLSAAVRAMQVGHIWSGTPISQQHRELFRLARTWIEKDANVSADALAVILGNAEDPDTVARTLSRATAWWKQFAHATRAHLLQAIVATGMKMKSLPREDSYRSTRPGYAAAHRTLQSIDLILAQSETALVLTAIEKSIRELPSLSFSEAVFATEFLLHELKRLSPDVSVPIYKFLLQVCAGLPDRASSGWIISGEPIHWDTAPIDKVLSTLSSLDFIHQRQFANECMRLAEDALDAAGPYLGRYDSRDTRRSQAVETMEKIGQGLAYVSTKRILRYLKTALRMGHRPVGLAGIAAAIPRQRGVAVRDFLVMVAQQPAERNEMIAKVAPKYFGFALQNAAHSDDPSAQYKAICARLFPHPYSYSADITDKFGRVAAERAVLLLSKMNQGDRVGSVECVTYALCCTTRLPPKHQTAYLIKCRDLVCFEDGQELERDEQEEVLTKIAEIVAAAVVAHQSHQAANAVLVFLYDTLSRIPERGAKIAAVQKAVRKTDTTELTMAQASFSAAFEVAAATPPRSGGLALRRWLQARERRYMERYENAQQAITEQAEREREFLTRPEPTKPYEEVVVERTGPGIKYSFEVQPDYVNDVRNLCRQIAYERSRSSGTAQRETWHILDGQVRYESWGKHVLVRGSKAMRLILYRLNVTQPLLMNGEVVIPTSAALEREAREQRDAHCVKAGDWKLLC